VRSRAIADRWAVIDHECDRGSANTHTEPVSAGWAAAVPPAGALAPATSPAPIRIVLADDRMLGRKSLRTLLQERADIEVLRGGGDVEAVIAEIQEHRPDILVLDLATPDSSAVDAVSRLRAQAPQTQIVVLAGEHQRGWAQPLLDAGACAFVAREAIELDLAPAVRAAARSERYVSVRVESGLKPSGRARTPGRLTPRETEVLRQIALGHTSVEIAGALHLSPRTVETHRARINKKLALATRAELVRYALRRGLLRA